MSNQLSDFIIASEWAFNSLYTIVGPIYSRIENTIVWEQPTGSIYQPVTHYTRTVIDDNPCTSSNPESQPNFSREMLDSIYENVMGIHRQRRPLHPTQWTNHPYVWIPRQPQAFLPEARQQLEQSGIFTEPISHISAKSTGKKVSMDDIDKLFAEIDALVGEKNNDE